MKFIVALAFAASLPATTYQFQSISGPPDAKGFFFHGINNAGTLVGQYLDQSNNIQGFIDNSGAFTTVTDPSSPSFTVLSGINNNGQIVGLLLQ